MTHITAGFMEYEALNKAVRSMEDDQITIEQANGQRYIGSALMDKHLFIKGTAGNALGCFLDGGTITVYGNGQDATGDTMNDGKIVIHGSCGDGTGYAMRGGSIYIRDSSGYRSGIHMKAYQEKQPLLIIGDRAGSFLGEYQAGGTIIVLGRNQDGRPPVGYFCGTGMHGGTMYLRCDTLPVSLPKQVSARDAVDSDKQVLSCLLDEYCTIFSFDKQMLLASHFFVLQANSAAPYRMLYTHV